MSQLGWIDFSPDDRNKVSNVLALLSETGTLDELGIGQIRDAYSDALFPGISTIQTRAKYFITVPRILRDYQELPAAKKRRYKGLQEYLKDRENEVAKILTQVHGDDIYGIIGRTRVDSGGVDRRPSVIYWNGLRTFSILKTSLSLADYCRQLDNAGTHSELEAAESIDGSDDADAHADNKANLVRPPEYDDEWMTAKKLHLDLSKKEAEFLEQKLITTPAIAHTVPAQLFTHGITAKALEIDATGNVESFELLAELLVKTNKVDQQCRHAIQLANEFSLAMEGPHIRYNILLAKNHNWDKKLKQYEEDYSQWKDKVARQNLFKPGCAERWLDEDKRVFLHWINPKPSNFVKDISAIMQNGANTQALDDRIKKQALINKDSRSLLHKKLDEKVGWVGIRRLDYRWGSAKIILQDIQDGLNA